MRILSISVFLRILLITSFALVAFMQVKVIQLSEMFLNSKISYEYYKENEINTSYGFIFIILALINSWYTNYISKKRNNGRILMRELVIPEMNLNDDEREAEITGKSAKVAFSVIIIATFLVLAFFVLVIPYLNNPLPYSVFTIAALPMIGLLTYFITYRVLYSR